MDYLLHTVASAKMMSMLDDFLGYNQVEVEKKDQHKISFTTPWGTFAYHRMPFSLVNVGATFQQGMELSSKDMKSNIIVIYLDDLIVFSNINRSYIDNLINNCIL